MGKMKDLRNRLREAETALAIANAEYQIACATSVAAQQASREADKALEDASSTKVAEAVASRLREIYMAAEDKRVSLVLPRYLLLAPVEDARAEIQDLLDRSYHHHSRRAMDARYEEPRRLRRIRRDAEYKAALEAAYEIAISGGRLRFTDGVRGGTFFVPGYGHVSAQGLAKKARMRVEDISTISTVDVVDLPASRKARNDWTWLDCH